MDFDLFMERYGYKMLFGLFGLVLLVIFGILGLYVYAVVRLFGLFVGGLLLVLALVYAFTTGRKLLDARAEAHAKYFYDSRQGKRP
ncbi:hypothetical protein [Thermococcus pacificus]|uniref:Uncharacterized protein n=1 Tax=Thermococcus pacificus TaxID=71998 RepID=A0A218P6V2_9EURY|nr:hypothetical protein [Thermococcus pacificus]ASJ06516.1 hypothetical protein A3L08_03820 [Thermococcus pacificus]